MTYYDLMQKQVASISFAVGIVGVLFGLPGHIDDGLAWLRWRQAMSPNVLNLILALGVSFLFVTLLAVTASQWRPLLPRTRLKKLARLLEEGKELDSAVTSAMATGSPHDFDLLLDFKAHTELIRLEIRRLFHIGIDTSLQNWPMIIRELAPLAKEGMHKDVKQKCEGFVAYLSEYTQPSSLP